MAGVPCWLGILEKVIPNYRNLCARQLRLKRYAQERDQLAGIVIYESDDGAKSDAPVDAGLGRPSAQQHTCAHEGDCGDEADRAMKAAVWDNIDTVPPEGEPVSFTDGCA